MIVPPSPLLSSPRATAFSAPDAAIEASPVAHVRLGRMAYGEAWALQRRIFDRKVAAVRTGEALPDVLLTVEHPPVYTLGRGADPANLLCLPTGAERFEVERGGDVTYHGPGQLVGYPILDLNRFGPARLSGRPDLGWYLRGLEEAIIRLATDLGIEAYRIKGRTGVWTRTRAGGPFAEAKFAAIGVKLSRWVTMHGFALNVEPELADFAAIVPCGISDAGVTSLARELGRSVTLDEAEARLLPHLAEIFGHPIRPAAPQALADAFPAPPAS